MEPAVEVYLPSRLYARIGWAALGGSAVCLLCGWQAPLALIPAFLCAITSAVLFWLGSRPSIRVSDTQFNVGERTIAWREVREINGSRLVSPLVLKIKLTNARKRLIVFPGEPERIARLIYQLRKNSYLATFDGVAYRDYWTWSSMTALRGDNPTLEQPVRMLSPEEEEEIERMYQKLKTVGRLDTRSDNERTPDDLA
ncbi:MAG TPA: hypothetical protein VHZ07_03965 [Bryobacteraceae bacterium]|jgi:hypothetical protein|nr:hypothetical protein [Bryobacteraceae bacterium]